MAGSIPPTGPPPPVVGPGTPTPQMSPRPATSNSGRWIIVGAVVLGLIILVSTGLVFYRFFGAFRGEIAEAKLIEEYWNYFYETYDLPDEPMFRNASAPIELLGNRTRNMLRELLAAQKQADDAERDHHDHGVWQMSAYTSETEYKKALERVDKMVAAYKSLSEVYAKVPDEYLPNLRSVVAGTSAETFYHQQEMFHNAETEIKKREAKVVADIGVLLRERAKICWQYRKHLREGRDGVAQPKVTAPRELSLKLDTIDSLVDAKYDEWTDLSRDLKAAFNKFYYTVTGQRQDEFSD